MKKPVFTVLFLSLFLLPLSSGVRGVRDQGGRQAQQETPPGGIEKPKYDYMSSFLARSTQPLGLKDAPEVRMLLEQSAAKWAIRSGKRQILN